MQRSALCRSRRELSNEYLLAKFGFDTAENELVKFARSPRAQIAQVVIKRVEPGWVGGLGIGVTLAASTTAPEQAWQHPNTWVCGYWGHVYWRGKNRPSRWKPEVLEAGDSVGIWVDEEGGSIA